MQNKLLIIPLAIILIVVLVLAKPDTSLVPATNNKADISLIIPAHAVEVAPNVFSLGTSQDIDGRKVDGFMYIDKKREAKPSTTCGNGICEAGENANKCPADCSSGNTTTSTCFAFIASGARWKTTENYVLDTTNNDNLTSSFVATNVELGINEWDSQVSFDIFGPRNTSLSVDGADTQSTDGKNEIFFGSVSDPDTIAVTIVWGIFRGPPFGRELVEYDMIFNEVYKFGDAELAPAPELMDFLNIFTHEQGHSAGLGHPDITCTEETMYAFASFNETKKRTLNDGDIAGIKQLYV